MDSPELRKFLSDVWQKSAVEALQRGVPGQVVAETMLVVAMAMLVEAIGNEAASAQLSKLATDLGQGAAKP